MEIFITGFIENIRLIYFFARQKIFTTGISQPPYLYSRIPEFTSELFIRRTFAIYLAFCVDFFKNVA